MMNWDDVRIFLAVARTGQILAASKRLGLNHATLSRRLTSLEEALKTRLFVRRTNGCELTAEGGIFLHAAERMETETRSLREYLEGFAKHPEPGVTVYVAIGAVSQEDALVLSVSPQDHGVVFWNASTEYFEPSELTLVADSFAALRASRAAGDCLGKDSKQ